MDCKICEESYQMQLLGYNTRIICDEVNNMVKENVEHITDSLKECLFLKLKCSRESIKSARDKFIEESMTVAMEHMKQLPSAVEEFLSLPPHMLLPEDTPQRIQYTKEQEMQLKREIDDLKDRANKASRLKAYFTKEIELQEKLLKSSSEYKGLENSYHKIELPEQSVQRKITEITEAISDTKGICSALSVDKECDLATRIRFENVGCSTDDVIAE